MIQNIISSFKKCPPNVTSKADKIVAHQFFFLKGQFTQISPNPHLTSVEENKANRLELRINTMKDLQLRIDLHMNDIITTYPIGLYLLKY